MRVRDTLRYMFAIAAAASITTNHMRARARFYFHREVLNKSRETAAPRGRIKRGCAGTPYYKEDAWHEGFPALTSSLAVRLVRACKRACVPACVSRPAVTHITKGGRESER